MLCEYLLTPHSQDMPSCVGRALATWACPLQALRACAASGRQLREGGLRAPVAVSLGLSEGLPQAREPQEGSPQPHSSLQGLSASASRAFHREGVGGASLGRWQSAFPLPLRS